MFVFILLASILICKVNNDFLFDKFEAPQIAKTEIGCSGSVVSAKFDFFPTHPNPSGPGVAPFQRRQVPFRNQDGCAGQLCVDMPLWSIVRQTPYALSRLQAALVDWNTAFQRTQRSTKISNDLCQPESGMVLGMDIRKQRQESATETAECFHKECKCKETGSQKTEREREGRDNFSFRIFCSDTLACTRHYLCLPCTLFAASTFSTRNQLTESGLPAFRRQLPKPRRPMPVNWKLVCTRHPKQLEIPHGNCRT